MAALLTSRRLRRRSLPTSLAAHRMYAVHRGLQMANRTLTINGSLFPAKDHWLEKFIANQKPNLTKAFCNSKSIILLKVNYFNFFCYTLQYTTK
jgi:hypothetical protein